VKEETPSVSLMKEGLAVLPVLFSLSMLYGILFTDSGNLGSPLISHLESLESELCSDLPPGPNS